MLEDVAEVNTQWAVDDDAERTVFIVFAYQRGGVVKVGVAQCRHRDEKMIVK